MLKFSILLLTAFVYGLVIPAPAHTGSVTLELGRVMQLSSASDEIPVIIALQDRVLLRNYRLGNKRLRRLQLVRNLRQKAENTQVPLRRFMAGRTDVKRVRTLWINNSLAVKTTKGTINRLAALPGVDYIRLDRTLQFANPVAPLAGPTEWNLDMVNAPQLWDMGYTGTGIVVGIMDTGVDVLHSDLSAAYRGGTNSWFDPHTPSTDPYDADGHGTQVAGVLIGGSNGGTAIGVAPDAQWIAAKIFDDTGGAMDSDIHAGFQFMLDPDGDPLTDDAPDIVNNSWGLIFDVNMCIQEYQLDIDTLRAAGIAVVFSAGNAGPGIATSLDPANNPGAFAVGSVNSASFISATSSHGPSACDGSIFPEIVAPGVSIRTTDKTFGVQDFYATVSGTSFAAPHVSGVMALLWDAFPATTLAELESALVTSAFDLGDVGADNTYGNGLLDAMAALTHLASAGLVQVNPLEYFVDENEGTAVVTVERLGGTTGAVSVDFTTVDGTATANTDYLPASGTLNWADGDNADQTVAITVIDDGDQEIDEAFNLLLSNPTGGALLGLNNTATVNILDNEPDADSDGISDSEEDAGPNGGDGDSSGTLDSLEPNVATFLDINGDYVTIRSPAGTALQLVTERPNPSPGDAPAGISFPFGFIDFQITGLNPGDSTTLEILLPPGTVPGTFYKYGRTPTNPIDHWYEFMFDAATQTGAQINGLQITLHFVDGDRGDDDLDNTNGIIVDVGGPGVMAAAGTTGGGGGCFIDTMASVFDRGPLEKNHDFVKAAVLWPTLLLGLFGIGAVVTGCVRRSYLRQ